MRTLTGILSAVAILSAPIAATAADIHRSGFTISINGPLDGASEPLFASAIQSAANAGEPLPTTVLLNSPGGLVSEGMGIADLVHRLRMSVVVPDNAMCASACFIIFAAGEHKTAGTGVRIGVHSATLTQGQGDDDGNGTMRMARYVAQMGVPAAIVGRMVETDSINMTWLSPAELRSMDVALPPDVPVAISQTKPSGFFASLFGDGVGLNTNEDSSSARIPISKDVANKKPGFFSQP